MGHGLHDLARHNAWATAQILEFCRGIDESTLHATTPGTFGTIIETMRHIIDSEASYLFRLTGAPWPRDDVVGLDVLVERATLLANTWEQFLATDRAAPPLRVPARIRDAIAALKVEHPALQFREIATICSVR